MNSSKFNICSNTRARIREQFFKRRSGKQNKQAESGAVVSCDKEESVAVTKVKEERHVIPEPRRDQDVSFVDKDDGFPMITSVFSLASCPGDEPKLQVCDSTGASSSCTPAQPFLGNSRRPETQLKPISFDMASTTTSTATSLPFVVQSANGVISVCSPPRSFATTKTGKITTQPPNHDQHLPTPVSIATSICQPPKTTGTNIGVTSDNTSHAKIKTGTNQNQLNQSSGALPHNPALPPHSPHNSQTKYTFPEEPPSEVLPGPAISTAAIDNKTEQNQSHLNIQSDESGSLDEAVETGSKDNSTTTMEAQSTREEKSEDTSATTVDSPDPEIQDVPFVTKQDDKIRRLKDLIRQQEKELEKLRFKGSPQGGSSSSRSTTGGKDLRIRLLRKSVSPGSEAPKSRSGGPQTKSTSNSALPRVELKETKQQLTNMGEKSAKSPTDAKASPSALKRKSDCQESPSLTPSCPADKTVASPLCKRKTMSASELPPHRTAVKDNYCLVNVTVVKGHTRTLAVPVGDNSKPTSLSNNPVTDTYSDPNVTTTKRKSVGTTVRANKLAKQDEHTLVTPSTSSKDTTRRRDHTCTAKSSISSKKDHSASMNKANKAASSSTTTASNPTSSEIDVPKRNDAIDNVFGNSMSLTSKTSPTTTTNANKEVSIPVNSSIGNSPTKQNLRTLESPINKSVGSHPSQLGNVNSSACLQTSNSLNTLVTNPCSTVVNAAMNTVAANTNIATPQMPKLFPVNQPNPVSLANAGISTNTNPSIANSQSGAVFNITSTINSPSAVLPPAGGESAKQALENLQKKIYELATSVRTGKNSAQGVTSGGVVSPNTSPNCNLSSRPLHIIAPKPPPIAGQSTLTGKQNDRVIIYSLPNTGSGSTTPTHNDLENSKVIVCNVIQPKLAPNSGQFLISPVNSDNGKMLFYVTKPAVGQTVGIINDKKVIFTSAKPPLTPKTQVDIQKISSEKRDGDSEFIPNADDSDFKTLVGLEHVVYSLNSSE